MAVVRERYDTGTLEQLYATRRDELVGLLTLAAGDRARAEDAVQDAFAQALAHWSRVSEYDEPFAWVRRVATNRILNQKRSTRRRNAAVARLASGGVASQVSSDAGEAVETRAQLVTAIERLPLRQRTALALRYLADLPVANVADAMGITDGAVRYHLHAARQALGPFLEDP